jgi:rubrerythrin
LNRRSRALKQCPRNRKPIISHFTNAMTATCHMTYSGRCPRCGYVLRYSLTNYSCDFCGLQGSRSAKSAIASVERSLREKVRRFLASTGNHAYRPSIVPVQLRTCIFCGFILPYGHSRCPACGSVQTESLTDLDQRVYGYILDHGGSISISQGAQELSISSGALRAAIERLKATGILSQE